MALLSARFCSMRTKAEEVSKRRCMVKRTRAIITIEFSSRGHAKCLKPPCMIAVNAPPRLSAIMLSTPVDRSSDTNGLAPSASTSAAIIRKRNLHASRTMLRLFRASRFAARRATLGSVPSMRRVQISANLAVVMVLALTLCILFISLNRFFGSSHWTMSERHCVIFSVNIRDWYPTSSKVSLYLGLKAGEALPSDNSMMLSKFSFADTSNCRMRVLMNLSMAVGLSRPCLLQQYPSLPSRHAM
mmetsp:Transcript_55116/g.160055  ORF Transcript_55116/g.160055 Transcript_55116/m.160055 type:complete len:244 (+) Transcript_55116:138-869(+)